MKTKGKTIKTTTPEPTKALAPRTTVWDALDKVLKSSSITHPNEVEKHVHGIAADVAVIAQKKDSIASHMRDIYTLVGKEAFQSLAVNVFPRLGLSTSSSNRLLASGQLLAKTLPDPIVRLAMMERSDKPITTTDQKTGAVILHPKFEKALNEVQKKAPLTARQDGTYAPEEIDRFTSEVRARFAELGKPAQTTAAERKANQHKHIVELVGKFLGQWGVEDSRKLILECNEMVETQAKTIAAPAPVKPVAAAQAKTA